jgi:ferredoxin
MASEQATQEAAPQDTQESPQEKAPRKKYFYHMEEPCTDDCVRKFLAAFATVLKHSNYKYALDNYSRVSMHCGRCATLCPVYEVTKDPKDIPCYRTNLLVRIYKRYFTLTGHLKSTRAAVSTFRTRTSTSCSKACTVARRAGAAGSSAPWASITVS